MTVAARQRNWATRRCWYCGGWWVGLVVMGTSLGMMAGCGRKEKKAAPVPPPPPPPAAETAPPPVPETPSAPPGGEQAPGQTSSSSPEAKPQEKPKRPEKVQDWRRDEYFSAKREGDPKLVEALRYFGQRFVGKPSAALMLEELIQVETPPAEKPEEKTAPAPGAPSQMPPGPMPPGAIPQEGPGWVPGAGGTGLGGQNNRIQLSQEALQMAIWALVINNTKESREILKKILMGKIDTGMDRFATETTLKLLATCPIAENEVLLLTALIAPETLRPPAQPQPSGPTTVPPGGPSRPISPPPPTPGLGPPVPGYRPGYSPGGTGEEVTAAWIQQLSLELTKNYGSSTLREKLAEYLSDPKVPLAVVERLGAFLWEAHPANLRAQLVLLRAPDTTEEKRRKLLEYFMKYSAESLAWLLGVPSGPVSAGGGFGPGTAPRFGPGPEGGFGMEAVPGIRWSGRPGGVGTPSPLAGPLSPGASERYPPGVPGPTTPGSPTAQQPDPNLPYQIAATLWGPEMQSYLTAALTKLDSLEEQGAVVVWAATVPTAAIRYQTYLVLKERWYDGPTGIQKAGFPTQWVCDPGFLVALKQLPRAKEFRSGGMLGLGAGQAIGSPASGRPGVGLPAGKSLPPAVLEKLQREQTEEEWLRLSGDLVLALCQRFHQGGLQEIERARLERRRPDFLAPLQDLPLQLHEPQLIPKPSYRAVLPGQQGKKVSGVSIAPTLIHYVRLEHKEKPRVVFEAYRRQLKTRRIYESQQMVWLDSLQPGQKEGLIRSIDVVISRGQTDTTPGGVRVGIPAAGASRTPRAKLTDLEEPLVIQILVIETQDPSQDPHQLGQTAQTPKQTQ